MGKTPAKRRLGRGLSGLIGDPVAVQTANTAQLPQPASDIHNVDDVFIHIPLERITPNPSQPRRRFNDASLERLASSIRNAGVMQPIVVRRQRNGSNAPLDGQWELVAGERRWRAAALAGLESIPAVVVEIDDRQTAEWALIENLQRDDLNPMERAWALKGLAQRHNLTHTQIAQRVGLDRSTVANFIRLTELEPQIAEMIEEGALTQGHGRTLLAIDTGDDRLDAARRCAKEGWSVRRLESFASRQSATTAPSGGAPQQEQRIDAREASRLDLERRIGETLGTRVSIRTSRNGVRGHVKIEFYNLDQFDGLLQRFGVEPQ